MVTLITRGRFTQSYVKGMVDAPEDREPAVRKLIEATGGKLISLYFTTGESDFMVIAEGDDGESIIAGLMGAAASGAVTDLITVRAWTGAQFQAIAAKASKAATAYRAPGKR